MSDSPQIITEHDTWVSVDPILGCKANCSYCYLHSLDLIAKEPRIRLSAPELISKLDLFFHKRGSYTWGKDLSPIPVCIGNYTDMLTSSEGLEYLLNYISLFSAQFPNHYVVIITKAVLDPVYLEQINALNHPVLVFISQSGAKKVGLNRIERGPVSSFEKSIENVRYISKLPYLTAIHFWRPVTEATVPDKLTALECVRAFKDAGALASVAIGLKGGHFLSHETLQNQKLLGGPGKKLPVSGELFPTHVEQWVLDAGRELDYPVYRHTSCAIALAMQKREALGTWRTQYRTIKCLPSSCPSAQRARCDSFRMTNQIPSEQDFVIVQKDLGIKRELISWNAQNEYILVEGEVDQSTLTITSHKVGFGIIPKKLNQNRAWVGSIGNDIK